MGVRRTGPQVTRSARFDDASGESKVCYSAVEGVVYEDIVALDVAVYDGLISTMEVEQSASSTERKLPLVL